MDATASNDEPEFKMPSHPQIPEGQSHESHLSQHPRLWINFIDKSVDAYNELRASYTQNKELIDTMQKDGDRLAEEFSTRYDQGALRLTESEAAANQLQQRVNQLEAEAQQAKQSYTPTGHANSSSKKFPDVPVFKGDKDMVDSFVYSLRAKLEANSDWYPDEQSKLGYAFLRLDGKASAQVLPQLNAPSDSRNAINTVEKFIKFIKSQFGAADEKAEAQLKIANLRHNNKNFNTTHLTHS